MTQNISQTATKRSLVFLGGKKCYFCFWYIKCPVGRKNKTKLKYVSQASANYVEGLCFGTTTKKRPHPSGDILDDEKKVGQFGLVDLVGRFGLLLS